MYWEVTISGLPRTLEPALTFWLFKQGSWGTQESLDFAQPNLKYEATIRPHPIISLNAYFDFDLKESAEAQVLNWVSHRVPGAKIKWELQTPQDWLKEWKKHFKPLTVAGLKILPAWKVKKKIDLTETIVIEPGMAFGTGTHATTRFAMELLAELRRENDLSGRTVLDVGAGSGILSVTAEKFGAKEITAVDNDPESWRECRKTFKLNKTKKCAVIEKQIQRLRGTYDVVVANIIDGVLMDLRENLWRSTKKGGHIILSGILADGARAFKRSFLKGSEGKIVKEISDEEWTALLILK